MRRISQATSERLARVAKGYTEDDRLIREARGWLLDCFGGDEETAEYIETMDVLEVILAVERYYAGGWDHFVELASPD